MRPKEARAALRDALAGALTAAAGVDAQGLRDWAALVEEVARPPRAFPPGGVIVSACETRVA